jgi:hypothetical protein
VAMMEGAADPACACATDTDAASTTASAIP